MQVLHGTNQQLDSFSPEVIDKLEAAGERTDGCLTLGWDLAEWIKAGVQECKRAEHARESLSGEKMKKGLAKAGETQEGAETGVCVCVEGEGRITEITVDKHTSYEITCGASSPFR